MKSPLIQAHLHAHGVVLRAGGGATTFITFRDEPGRVKHYPDRRDPQERQNARDWNWRTTGNGRLNPLADAFPRARAA